MKKTLKKSFLIAFALTLAFGVAGRAQSAADSVWLTVVNDETAAGVQDGAFAVEIWLSNSVSLSGGTLGFTWSDTANWRVDSGTYGPATSSWEIKTPDAIDTAQANALGAALIGGGAIFNFTPVGSGQLYGTIYFSEKAGSSWGAGSVMTIDSSFVPPGGDFLIINSADNSGIIPTFLPALKVTFNDVLGGEGSALPTEFELAQNYPNPFNPSTKIEYGVPVRSAVKLEVFNILGQKVKTLIDRELDAGYASITWNGDNDAGSKVSSGVYFYKFTAGDVVQTRKMMLMK